VLSQVYLVLGVGIHLRIQTVYCLNGEHRSTAVKIDQYDIMRYEQLLSEFLDLHSDFEDQLSEWRSGLTRHGERLSLDEAPESEMSIAHAREAHPLFSRIATTREETNRYFRSGDIRMLIPVVDVINAGRAIEVFDELGVKNLFPTIGEGCLLFTRITPVLICPKIERENRSEVVVPSTIDPRYAILIGLGGCRSQDTLPMLSLRLLQGVLDWIRVLPVVGK